MITGHTGFKGTWLSLLLLELGIEVVGYSLAPTRNSIYNSVRAEGKIPEIYEDIRNESALTKFIETYQPSAIIHLAAQPLVIESYLDPVETFDVNVMGTVKLIEIARKSKCLESIIVATTDKVYKNENLGRRFIESDSLEGKDPYSASKVSSEAIIASYQHMLKTTSAMRLISVRAGNVIGGGDYSEHRLIPDSIRAHLSDEILVLRNPNSIRPWQHVLEPLVGYLLAMGFGEDNAYNFGPMDNYDLTVIEVVKLLQDKIPFEFEIDEIERKHYESELLSLDSELARRKLGWRSIYTQHEAISKTADWWQLYFSREDMLAVTKNQIRDYISSL